MGVIRTPFVSGTILNNPLAIGDVTLSSLGLGGLSAVVAPDIAKCILDPAGSAGNPEVVYITAHIAAATTATITRGAEGSTARAHAVGIPWIVGPTSLDFGWTSTPATGTAYNPLDPFLRVITTMGTTAVGSVLLGANVAVLAPIAPIASDVTCSNIVWNCTAQSGNYDIGIYMWDGTTMTKIITLGTTACPATGKVTSDITDTVLYRGTRYFFAIAFDNGTAGLSCYSGATFLGGYYTKAASFVLPATITTPSAGTVGVPAFVGNVTGGVTF